MTKRNEPGKAASGAGQDAALGALATLASVALGANPVGATLVGGSAPVIKYVKQVWDRAGERRAGRAARSLEHAADLLDVGLDIMVERAAGHDARLELLAQVLEAAARTSMEDKIQALGQILADGLRSDSHLDKARLLASMVNDLEAPHVIVLKLIAEQPVPPESMWSNPGGLRGWERTQLALALSAYDGFLDGVLAALIRHGALRNLGDGSWDGVANSGAHGITTLGNRCLQLFGHETTHSPNAPDARPVLAVLAVGDRHFDGDEHQVVELAGTNIRLLPTPAARRCADRAPNGDCGFRDPGQVPGCQRSSRSGCSSRCPPM